MTRTRWQPLAAFALVSMLAACGGSKSDVRQTAFSSDTDGATRAVGFDREVAWSCGDADVQAAFSTSFTGDALVAAIKAAIADPKKPDATFSFVDPITSFFTDFDNRALCVTIDRAAGPAETDALVRQLRASGNVVSVRAR